MISLFSIISEDIAIGNSSRDTLYYIHNSFKCQLTQLRVGTFNYSPVMVMCLN